MRKPVLAHISILILPNHQKQIAKNEIELYASQSSTIMSISFKCSGDLAHLQHSKSYQYIKARCLDANRKFHTNT